MSRIALVWIVYPLVCHFCSLEKNHLTRSGFYNDTRGGAIFDLQGHDWQDLCRAPHNIVVNQIYKLCVMLLQRSFFMCFQYKSMVDNDIPGAWPVWTPGAPLAAFISSPEPKVSL